MHGHIHESTRITGSWTDQLGETVMFNAANDKKDLSVIKFDLADPKNACRKLY